MSRVLFLVGCLLFPTFFRELERVNESGKPSNLAILSRTRFMDVGGIGKHLMCSVLAEVKNFAPNTFFNSFGVGAQPVGPLYVMTNGV